MPKKWRDLEHKESIVCGCGNNTWSLKIMEKTQDILFHIRIICAKCNGDIPELGKRHYGVCQEFIHYDMGVADEDEAECAHPSIG